MAPVLELRRRETLAPALPAKPLLALNAKSPGLAYVSGEEHTLTLTPWRLLLCLARHAGELVTYETIQGEVWTDAVVEQQQVLAHRVKLLAQLGEPLKNAGFGGEWIKLHYKIGLRLTLPASRVEVASDARAPT